MFFFVDTSFVCASKELQETKKKELCIRHHYIMINYLIEYFMK